MVRYLYFFFPENDENPRKIELLLLPIKKIIANKSNHLILEDDRSLYLLILIIKADFLQKNFYLL